MAADLFADAAPQPAAKPLTVFRAQLGAVADVVEIGGAASPAR